MIARSSTGDLLSRASTPLSMAPAILLLLVNLLHATLVRSHQFAPSNETSFGMLASNDEASSRQLRAWGEGAGGTRTIEIPDRMQYEKIQVLTLPSERRLERFGRNLARFELEGDEPSAIHIEVWRTQYDSRTLRPRSQRIREFTLDLGPAER